MSTVSEELADTEKDIARWSAEIASGNISIFTLDQLADARGRRTPLEVLAMSWPSEDRRRASAERSIVEAKSKLAQPGAASIMAKANIDIMTRYLSGEIRLG